VSSEVEVSLLCVLLATKSFINFYMILVPTFRSLD